MRDVPYTVTTGCLAAALASMAGCAAPDETAGPPSFDAPAASSTEGRVVPTTPPRAFPGPCTEYRDALADGSYEIITHYRYDDLGRRILIEHDTFADGFSDYRQAKVFAADGLSFRETIDSHGNGIIDITTDAAFRPDGAELSWQRDEDGDGDCDRTRISHYVGDLVESRTETFATAPTTTTYFDYDESGNVTAEDTYQDDLLIASSVRSYDQDDRLLSAFIDDDGDGNFDRHTLVIHAPGMTTRLFDVDGDVIPEWTELNWLDELGRPLANATDAGNDDDFEWSEWFEYQGDQVLSHRVDDTGDGRADRHTRHVYRDELLTATWRDFDGDGTFDYVERFEYDSAGNRIRLLRDNDADGVMDAEYRFDYSCF